jgi:hypothetical protein
MDNPFLLEICLRNPIFPNSRQKPFYFRVRKCFGPGKTRQANQTDQNKENRAHQLQ